MVPPLTSAGWVYTWGSGFHGQLGQEDITVSLTPGLVKELCGVQTSCKSISCGSHHNAIITQDGELYTWGSNKNYCLGHQIDEEHVEYTPVPGHCGGFGAIVDRVGRGLPRSVACGKEVRQSEGWSEGWSEATANSLSNIPLPRFAHRSTPSSPLIPTRVPARRLPRSSAKSRRLEWKKRD